MRQLSSNSLPFQPVFDALKIEPVTALRSTPRQVMVLGAPDAPAANSVVGSVAPATADAVFNHVKSRTTPAVAPPMNCAAFANCTVVLSHTTLQLPTGAMVPVFDALLNTKAQFLK